MDIRPLRPALQALRTRIRGLYLLHGVGRAAAVLAVLLLASFLMDASLEPPRAVRAVHGVLSLAVFAVAIRRFLVRPVGRTVTALTDEELALAVEARVPRLQDRLVSALQWERILADPECGESETFMAASAAEAAGELRTVRAAALTDAGASRRSFALGAAAAGAFLLATALWHEQALVWARRCILLLDEPWPQRTTLVAIGFDPEHPTVVTIGDDLPLRVRVDGAIPDDGVTLHYQTLPAEGGRVDRDARAMLQSAEDPRTFAFTFHEVPVSFRFWVTGGDDVDGEPRYTVTALVPPAIEEVAADLLFPPRTGLPPERRTDGDLEVPAGTRVDLAVRSTVPLRSASFVHPVGGAPAEVRVDPDGRTVRTAVVVERTADWRLDMVALDGARSDPDRCTRRFTALPDPRPEVRMLLPASRVHAVADGRVPVKVRATDNYSLVKVSLEAVPGRGRPSLEIPLWAPAPPGPGPAPAAGPAGADRQASAYRLLDLATLFPPEGEQGLPFPPGEERGAREEEVLLRCLAEDNGGSTAATEQVAIQVTDAAELLRRLSQRQVRIREDLDSLRRHLEAARAGAVRAREAVAAGADLAPGDRESLRSPAGLAGRSVREAAGLADALGDAVLTYCMNRLLENRVASDRVVSIADEWLREDREPPTPVLQPGLWRRLAAARESREVDDDGILGSLLEAVGLADRLSAGPASTLRDRLEGLASGGPAAAAAEAEAAAEEALRLVREISSRLQEWETMHEILEAARSLVDQQEAIRTGLGGAGGRTPAGR